MRKKEVIKSIKNMQWSRSFVYQIVSCYSQESKKKEEYSYSVRLLHTKRTEQKGQKQPSGPRMLT